jgi:hypothetical protein
VATVTLLLWLAPACHRHDEDCSHGTCGKAATVRGFRLAFTAAYHPTSVVRVKAK